MAAPVESKVKAGAAGAPLGVAVGGFACWLVDAYVHTPGKEGDLPGAVTLLVMAATASAVTFGSAWLAKHTHREPKPLDVNLIRERISRIKAHGGPVPSGGQHVVGETGPEHIDLPGPTS